MLVFLADHWLVSLLLILAAGKAVAGVVAAAVAPLHTWRRPCDCPRCGGTGRDPG